MAIKCSLRSKSAMKPRKISVCMTPARHSRWSMRCCKKPLTSTLRSRASGASKRSSLDKATTMLSLRQASQPKPAKASTIIKLIAVGLIVGAA